MTQKESAWFLPGLRPDWSLMKHWVLRERLTLDVEQTDVVAVLVRVLEHLFY